MRGTIDAEALSLFMILFLWQLPHFLAIAWIYRDDYARAGLKMLPVADPSGTATGRKMIGFCAALVLASFAPVLVSSGPVYLGGALLLGGMFLATTVAFLLETSVAHARRVLRASLIYLPLLLALLMLERFTESIAYAFALAM